MDTSLAPVFLVVGESVLDAVRTETGLRETPGGSPANVAIGLAALGRRTRLVTQLCQDRAGDLLRAHLTRPDLELLTSPTPSGRSSTAVATLDQDGAASYAFDLDFGLGDVPSNEQILDGADYLHIGSVAAIWGERWWRIRELVEQTSDSVVVSYDINLRPTLTGIDAHLRRRVEALAGAVDLVKASDEDLAALMPELSLDSAMAAILGLGAEAVVVTLGAEGSRVLTRSGVELHQPSQAVTVVDTIGAGDSFMAGMLDAIAQARGDSAAPLSPHQWGEVLARGAATSAWTVARAGAGAPSRAEVDAAGSAPQQA